MSGKKKQRLPQLDPKYRNPGVSGNLPIDTLASGQPYQRPVERRDVKKLIQKWDARKLTPIIVSLRSGKFYVVDGQHRLEAIRQMANGKNVAVPCLVYTGLTYEDEAEMYAELDQAKKRLTLPQSINALLESGSDAEIVEIKRLVEGSGFVWALTTRTGAPFEIEATRALINAYRLLGRADFSRMLELLAATWHGAPNSLRASMLSGVALFLKTYGAQLNDHAFIKRLSIATPEDIIRASRVEYDAALRVARTVREKYNTYPGGLELPYRFRR